MSLYEGKKSSTKIEIQSKILNFDVELESNDSSTDLENGYEYSEASIKISLKRNKVGFDKILFGYYSTTGIFSAMSLLAFFIDPAVVCSNDFFSFLIINFKGQSNNH